MYSIRLRWDNYTWSADSPCPNDFIPAVSSFQKLKGILIILLASWGSLESAIMLPESQEAIWSKNSWKIELLAVMKQAPASNIRLQSWSFKPSTPWSVEPAKNHKKPGWGTFQIVCLFVSCLYFPFVECMVFWVGFLHLTKKGKQHNDTL